MGGKSRGFVSNLPPAVGMKGMAFHRFRRLLLPLLLGSCVLPCAAAKKPNILLLLADDQRADSIGAMGNPHVNTPNLDSLAAQGMRFRANYVAGGNTGAICSPSRAMLMTGRTYSRIEGNQDIYNLPPQPMLPDRLRAQGYRTYMTGKWHNGEAALLNAFDEGGAIYKGGMGNHLTLPVSDLVDGKLTPPKRVPKFSTETFTDRAVSFLKDRKDDKPFFLYVAFTVPHDPRMPQSPWKERYEANPPPAPANFLPQHPFDLGCLTIRDENLAPWPRPEWMVREQLGHYYALIDQLDAGIGRILKALDDTGERENTIIVYAADNGLSLGSHGLMGKQSAYEEAMRVPLIVSGPGVKKGGDCKGVTALYDLMPTLCEAGGAPVPDGLDGRSLWPVLRGEKAGVRDRFAFGVRWQGVNMLTLREGDWKLIRYPRIDHTQLFDLGKDPDEMHDLAGDPAQAVRVKSMLAALKQELAKQDIKDPLTVKKPEKKEVDLAGHKQAADSHQPKWIVERYFNRPSNEVPADFGKAR